MARKKSMSDINIDECYERYCDSHWIPPEDPDGKLISQQLFSVIPMEHSRESFAIKMTKDLKFRKKWEH